MIDAVGDEWLLNTIASQSRNDNPKNIKGLFRRTKEWGHDSIQEFATYIFHFHDISRVTLAQLTRHRVGSYNVKSGRHKVPTSATLPSGVKGMHGWMYGDGFEVNWVIDENNDFHVQGKLVEVIDENVHPRTHPVDLSKLPIPIGDIRYGFPLATNISCFAKFNGRSLRNFLKLRMDKHAQWEIRALANEVFLLVREIHPHMVEDLVE